MEQESEPTPWTERWLPGFVATVLVSAAILGILRAASPLLYDYDGYYHIRYAQILRTQGFFRTFPWWQETFLRDHWADKDFLFHVLLIPFTFGNLLVGAKVAAVCFSSLTLGVFYSVARRLGAATPVLWTFGLIAASATLLCRLDFTRPATLAVALALGGTLAILRGNARWAAVIAAIYANTHISYHLLPCVALLHDFHRTRNAAGRRSFRVSLWTAGGAVAGVVLSPYFPNNLRLFWVQNVQVLGASWAGGVDLKQGVEFLPTRTDLLVRENFGVLVALAVGGYLLARARRASPEALSLLTIAAGFLGLTFMSVRFIEFLGPFAMLFVAVAARDDRQDEAASVGPPRRRGFRWARAAVIVALGALLFAKNAKTAWDSIAKADIEDLSPVGAWMNANIPAGETVFHTSWDDFPQLFYFAPRLRYLVGLDPAFMYVTDPERWKLWDRVAAGKVEDPYGVIRDTFKCRFVFASSDDEGVLAAARRDPRFNERLAVTEGRVYSLTDGLVFATDWRIQGWYRDPERRLFDVPLGPEPSRAASASRPELPSKAEGPAAGGLDVETPSGFVDLARLLVLPEGVTDACAVAETRVTAPAGTEATVAVTTDDAIRVYVDGEAVLESSPFRRPPPGSTGGAPISLDDLGKIPAPNREQTARVTLRRGAASIVVKDCRHGEDFGFCLRVFREDGSPIRSAGSPTPGARASH